MKSWDFIDAHIIDHIYGEWISELNRECRRIQNFEKAGPWKCPYHNARACMEIVLRVEEIQRGGTHQ